MKTEQKLEKLKLNDAAMFVKDLRDKLQCRMENIDYKGLIYACQLVDPRYASQLSETDFNIALQFMNDHLVEKDVNLQEENRSFDQESSQSSMDLSFLDNELNVKENQNGNNKVSTILLFLEDKLKHFSDSAPYCKDVIRNPSFISSKRKVLLPNDFIICGQAQVKLI
ncbi:unnamed protein product [Bursaphelenchus okinawaensis]|uniref:Uncharacterized protein n=1 Tax=Bursaphelenchus okinawaensis TaxID=465554 RepID=A0A811LFU1_9BILA|nr:unnamed protein product [Bursaphelenchus okinawaensis]CAG9121654.1 unnamed protein product [Bursaphelenchus okinawaensis]